MIQSLIDKKHFKETFRFVIITYMKGFLTVQVKTNLNCHVHCERQTSYSTKIQIWFVFVEKTKRFRL